MRDTLHEALLPVVRDPHAWFACAHELSVLLPEFASRITDELRRSAAEPGRYPLELMPLARAFLLLSGYAAENYIKGLWFRHRAAQGSAPPDDAAAFLPPGLAVHTVRRLVGEAGITLTPTGQETLKFLIQSVTWYARYPFPLAADAFTLFGISEVDLSRVNDLLATLRTHVDPSGAA